MASKQARMASFLNYRMRVVIDDGRILVGRFMAFDKYMNIILGDCDEFRLIKAHGKTEEHEEKRILGLTLLRGECVISLSVEAPPTQDRVVSKAQTVGAAKPAGRGMAPVISAAPTAAPAGLSGPATAVGAPPFAAMMPAGRGFPLAPGLPLLGVPGFSRVPVPPGMPPPSGMPSLPGMPPVPGMPMMPGFPRQPVNFPLGRGMPPKQ